MPWKHYLVIGFKLLVLMVIAGLIMIVPTAILRIIRESRPVLGIILTIPAILLAMVVDGWLVYKYRTWLLR